MITSFRGEYAFLSNMYECTIEFDGLVYPSVENAYQAYKCLDDYVKTDFTKCSPRRAKQYGREVAMRPDFDSIKEVLMRKLIGIKFDSHPDLKNKLIATAPLSITEGNQWHDSFWGICSCPKCTKKENLNKLGEILQEKRAEYKPDPYIVRNRVIYEYSTGKQVHRPSVMTGPDGRPVMAGEYEALEACARPGMHITEAMLTALHSPYRACETLNLACFITGNEPCRRERM